MIEALEEALGVAIIPSWPFVQPCPACDGRGSVGFKDCRRCDGTGVK